MTAMSRILGVTSGLLLVLLACGPQVVNTRSELGGPPATGGSGNATGAFAFAEAKALMDKSCNGAGCHSAPGAGGIPLETLADVKKFFDVSIASVTATPPRMPIGGKPNWTAAEIASLNAWKAAGFPETAAAPAGGGAGGAAVSFATDIAPMVKTGCAGAGCHEGAAPAGGIPLTNLQEVQDYYDLSLEDVTKVPPTMPIGRPLWTADQVQKFKDWKTGGFKP